MPPDPGSATAARTSSTDSGVSRSSASLTTFTEQRYPDPGRPADRRGTAHPPATRRASRSGPVSARRPLDNGPPARGSPHPGRRRGACHPGADDPLRVVPEARQKAEWAPLSGGLLADRAGPDRQAALGVKELQVRGVHGELGGLARADPAAGGDAGGPQRSAADQDADGFISVGAAACDVADAGVADGRGVDGEQDMDLAAELLGDVGGNGDLGPGRVGDGSVLEVGWAHADDDLAAEI